MTWPESPILWGVFACFIIAFLSATLLVLAYWISRRHAMRMGRRSWLCADLADIEEMARFEACDVVAVAFVSPGEFAKIAQEDPGMHRWRYQRVRWGVLELPTGEEGMPASVLLDWVRPEAAPSGVLVAERNGRWQVLIGPLISAEHRHRILLSDDGFPEELLTIAQVYRNWRHPRLPPLRA